MKLSKKTINLGIALIAVNLILFVVHWFVSGRINKNIEELSVLAADLDLQVARESQLKSVKGITKETEMERKELDSFLVSSDGVVSLIEEIESLASLAGLSVEIDSVGIGSYSIKDSTSQHLETLNIELESNSSWSNTFYFLNLLESMPYKVDVKRVIFEAGNNEAGSSWQSTFNLEFLKIK